MSPSFINSQFRSIVPTIMVFAKFHLSWTCVTYLAGYKLLSATQANLYKLHIEWTVHETLREALPPSSLPARSVTLLLLSFYFTLLVFASFTSFTGLALHLNFLRLLFFTPPVHIALCNCFFGTEICYLHSADPSMLLLALAPAALLTNCVRMFAFLQKHDGCLCDGC